ncbi:MAG: hypothetical protein ACRDOK_00035 [Streptosporangiaceae bacterium]
MKAPLSRPGQGSAAVAGSAVADHAEPAAAPLPAPPPWYSRPATQGLFALLLYAAAWLTTVGRHTLHHVGDAHLDQRSMDPNFYTWSLQWWPYAIGHAVNPFYSHLVWAPHGHSLAWVTTVPPIALLAAPLTLTAGPIVAFNLLATLALPLSAWAAFVLCRRLTRKFWPALVGGAVFGFSAYEMNHLAAGQLNLTYSLLIPLLAYLVVLWRENAISSRMFVIVAGITMAVQFYLFLETFADLTAVLVLALVVGLLVAGRAHRAEVLRLARSLTYAYGVAFLLALPYLAYALTSRTPALKADTSLDLLSLVVPRPDRITGASWLHDLAKAPVEVSLAGYVGLPLLALAVLLLVTGWSRRLVRFLACMLVVIIVASLGPALNFDGGRVVTLPWFWLWRLPIVRNAYPSRLMLFAFLALAVMTALWLASTSSRLWLRVPVAALIVVALYQDAAIINVAHHSTVPAFIAKGTYRHQLSPGETVVVVSSIGNAGMLWQADTGFYLGLAGGYLNQSITRRSDLPRPVQRLAHATPANVRSFEAYVRKDRIGAILLDRNHEPKWVGIFWRMGLKGHDTGNVVVYPLNGCRSCRRLGWSQIEHGGSQTALGSATSPPT